MHENTNKSIANLENWCFRIENQLSVQKTALDIQQTKHDNLEVRVQRTEEKLNFIDEFIK